MTIPPLFRRPVAWLFIFDESYDMSLNMVNAAIMRTFQNDTCVKVLDCYGVLTEKMKYEKLSSDGLHLNEKGYIYLNAILDTL